MKLKLSLLPLFFSYFVFGQSHSLIKQEAEKPFIEVTGTASKEVTPDKIFVSISLTNKIIDKQQYTIQEQESRLKKILSDNKIDLGLLSLRDANSEILMKRRREAGFQVNKIYILQLSTADQVSQISKELQDLNIKETSIVKLEHSKIDSLRKEVRISAIKAAKTKAEYLLAAIGEQIGKPIEVKEIVENSYFRDNFKSNVILNQQETKSEEGDTEVEFEKIKIKFSYYIKYEIKN
ncbi:MAG: SIMPL domain-containing protein [Leadbetterella sp.]